MTGPKDTFSAEDFKNEADGPRIKYVIHSQMLYQAAANKRELDEARSTIEKLCKTERQIIEHLRDNVTEKMKNAARRHYYLDDAFVAMLNAALEELPK